jgi:hypothetical protein
MGPPAAGREGMPLPVEVEPDILPAPPPALESAVAVSAPPRSRVTVAAPAEFAAEASDRKASCTLAQMRRFIKSRPYVPLHELRRRFEIGGIEDEVSLVVTGNGQLFVGLPPQEAGFLAELVTSGEVGYELLLDPTGPAVVGVFPMRPVARQ